MPRPRKSPGASLLATMKADNSVESLKTMPVERRLAPKPHASLLATMETDNSVESLKTMPVECLLAQKPHASLLATMETDNSVKSLKTIPFEERTLQEQLRVKEFGPHHPDISIQQQENDRGRQYTRSFSTSWFGKKSWLTACSETNALFCFPCLLFHTKGSSNSEWIETGVTDLKHMSDKIKTHEQTRVHMENAMRLAMFGKVNIAAQLDEGYRIGIRKHNEEVDKNKHILSKIIDCVKFCGAFELALCGGGHDESDGSATPGVFRGLVDFVASLDAALQEHLQNATVFKGTSNNVQNELLDCMLCVLREYIIEEIRSADFVSIQVDETTGISTECQLVLVMRYIDKAHVVQERFLEFIPLQSATDDSIATALLDRLSSILPDDQKSKLISQAYGASVMRGATGGVQKMVQYVYVNAHYVHCYAHQLNLVMQQVTSRISRVTQFFSDLAGFSVFFARSPKRTSVLDKVVALRVARARTVSWDFHSRTVNTVFEHKDDLLQSFEIIRDSGEFDPATIREAGGFVRLLEDEKFSFFLELFHRIMHHVDYLYSQLQYRAITSVFVDGIIQKFTDSMQKIRDFLPTLCGEHGDRMKHGPVDGMKHEPVAFGIDGDRMKHEPVAFGIDANGISPEQGKRRRTLGPDELQSIATEVCDTILGHAKERFSFTKHLISATLLQGDKFKQYNNRFPEAALHTTMVAYPLLNKSKLKMELSLIYGSDDFKSCSGAVALYQLFMVNNLQDTFSETVALLRIMITTPMTTDEEAERCFSTLKRIKTFLRNTMSQDRLNALAMLSMEKKLIKDIPDFNNRVIEKFASLKERRATFMYK